MKKSTTLKLPPRLKARIARVAKKAGRTPHAFMLEALERQTTREERMEAFVHEAVLADRAIGDGGDVYSSADVHAWLAKLARGVKAARPKPWRG